MAKYKATRNFSAGRDEKGQPIIYTKGKVYDKAPKGCEAYFEKKEDEKPKASK